MPHLPQQACNVRGKRSRAYSSLSVEASQAVQETELHPRDPSGEIRPGLRRMTDHSGSHSSDMPDSLDEQSSR